MTAARKSTPSPIAPMALDEAMPVRFGNLSGTIYGGPFRRYVQGTRRLVGVKMAEEIAHPHEVAVDTADFSVPEVKDMQIGMMFALEALVSGKDIYAGCMGGTGRTGTFMGCMAKLMADYDIDYDLGVGDPVLYVRKHYRAHAIETADQERYVRSFDTGPVLEHLNTLTAPRIEYVDKPVDRIVEKIVERTVYLGPVEWASYQWHQFWGKKS